MILEFDRTTIQEGEKMMVFEKKVVDNTDQVVENKDGDNFVVNTRDVEGTKECDDHLRDLCQPEDWAIPEVNTNFHVEVV